MFATFDVMTNGVMIGGSLKYKCRCAMEWRMVLVIGAKELNCNLVQRNISCKCLLEAFPTRCVYK